MQQRFFDLPIDKPELPSEQRVLYRLLVTILRFVPVMHVLNGVAIFSIFLLGWGGFFDRTEPLLILVALSSWIGAALYIPIYPLLKRGGLDITQTGIQVANAVIAVTQVFLWNRIEWLPVSTIVFSVLGIFVQKGLSIRTKVFNVIFGIIAIAIALASNSFISYERIEPIYLTNMAALSIYLIFAVSMVLFVILNSVIDFRTIASRLIVIFALATALSTLITVVTTSQASYLKNQKDTFHRIGLISDAKVAHIQTVLNNLKKQAEQPLHDVTVKRAILNLLQNNPGELGYEINLALVGNYFENLKLSGTESEVLLVRPDGRSVFSTNPENKDKNFSESSFLKATQTQVAFSIEKDFPAAEEPISLLVLSPLLVDNQFVGLIVSRTDFAEVSQVIESLTGSTETIETYLVGQVDGKVVPLTKTRGNADEITTTPVQQTFASNQQSGSDFYENYAGIRVLGYYIWIPELQATLITEIERQEVLAGITNTLIINVAIGFITTLLAFVIVFTTSQTISRPVVDLAEKATALASGELSTRMSVDRQDEIGTLASSFNTMASELQTLVRTLEQKVEDRTRDLQKQASYLRVAAEVARDSTTARDLDELLNRAAQLVLERFGFYHTGIFIIDPEREYAILRASPTEAGREMLAKNHQLKVGQAGIVGYVAATGEPRIALDIVQDLAYTANPFLPNTRSEMAIPLKTSGQTIGVLDVQSDKPEAFTQDDISALQIMADQLALAVQRVTLAEDTRKSYEELQKAYQEFTEESWQKFVQEPDFISGYRFDGIKVTPLESFPEATRDVLKKGRAVVLPASKEGDKAGSTIAAPLKVREQVIGVMTIHFNTDTVAADLINLVEETSGRLAIALENARLYAETQKLAQRERAVSEISSQITTSFNVENILRTTVLEIGKILPEAEVTVQLEQNKEQ